MQNDIIILLHQKVKDTIKIDKTEFLKIKDINQEIIFCKDNILYI